MAARNFPQKMPDAGGWLQLLLQIGAAARAARRHLAGHVAASELNEQEFLVLWLCDDATGGKTPIAHRGQGELAEAVGVSPAQMSGLVERLRVRNLLKFERCGTDRRRQVWQLTTAGQALLTAACQALVGATCQLPGSLTLAEQQQLSTLLARWLPSSDDADLSTHSTPDQEGPSSCAA